MSYEIKKTKVRRYASSSSAVTDCLHQIRAHNNQPEGGGGGGRAYLRKSRAVRWYGAGDDTYRMELEECGGVSELFLCDTYIPFKEGAWHLGFVLRVYF